MNAEWELLIVSAALIVIGTLGLAYGVYRVLCG